MIVMVTFVMSLVFTVAGTPLFIQFFQRKKLGQITREEGPLWHEAKAGTPTMGGTVFVLSICLTILLIGLLYQAFTIDTWLILLTMLLFGGIGFVDDFISIFLQRNEGLTARQKFLAQVAFSILIVFIARVAGETWELPIFAWKTQNIFVILMFAFIWITGFSNAVNLTDGLDGLATGTSIIAYLTYSYLAYMDGNRYLAYALFAVVGALIGFLFFNLKPARIFMGDVGSLALGAGLAVTSLILNRPWSLVLIGIIFVIETLSVILQVASFKLTGQRIFKMSPIHHHFEMIGWSEKRIVYTFWFVGLLGSIVYLFFAI